MNREEYIKLVDNSKIVGSSINTYFGNRNDYNPIKICNIAINSDDWVQFTCDNFDLAQHKIEQPRLHYDEHTNKISNLIISMGRDAGNTKELNFGLNGNSNDVLCEMLGQNNIELMGLKRRGLLLRLIMHAPGHGICWHEDGGASYLQKYPELNKDLSKVKRLWFPAVPWENGHVFQVGTKLLSHWSAGDVWHLPWGIPHGSSNFGYTLKYSVSVTGICNE